MTDETDALDAIAVALYAGLPADFVRERNARAGEAAGEAAATIKAWRRPSVAAWVVNLFAHERAAQLAEALDLAAQLREAQADLDAATLARLGRERRALTHRLAVGAVELARARGERITPSTQDAVQQTLSAAFFDPDAAAAVASGRLVRALEPSETVDLAQVVAGRAPDAPAPTPAPADEGGARRARRGAERAVQDAEKTVARSERAHGAAEKAHAEAARRAAELSEQVKEYEAALARARIDAEEARAAVDRTEERRAAEAGTLSAAETALAEARSALNRL